MLPRTLRRAGLAFSLLVLLLIALAGGGVALYGRASLPVLEGAVTLPRAATPAARVVVARDAHGIPHIVARTDGDAYFALGFVHAQDRLWQLDMNRRIASGTLSEVLGARTLPLDQFMRTLGVKRNAERIYRHLSPDTRFALERYAAGINAYLATRGPALPIEYLMTGAPAPIPWTPEDSVAWLSVLAWDLGGNMALAIERMRLAQRLPLAQIRQLVTTAPEDATPMATIDYVPMLRGLSALAVTAAAALDAQPSQHVEGLGSNNWVVAGSRSESGLPMLANDPHLGLSTPPLFYLAHLRSDRLNVAGGTVPGLPVVLIGHNEQIAWGMTNTGTSVEDLFIEQVDLTRPDYYRTPGGWARFATRTETIAVKGQPAVRWTVRETRHGPVISDVSANARDALRRSSRYVLALQWTALMPDDTTMEAGLGFDHARDWPEFLRAAAKFDAPQQNIVYADRHGNIGFVAPGRVPIRRPDNDLMTEVPAPGWDARYDWSGFVPFDALPQALNPPAARIVTANNRIVPRGYPYFLSGEWVLPYRYKRITALLDARATHSLDSFAAIQADIQSPSQADLLPLLIARAGLPADRDEADALARLRRWDRVARADEAEPLIASAWERAAAQAVFEPRAGRELFAEYWRQRNLHQALLNALRDPAIGAAWCGKAAGAAAPAPCSAQVGAALRAALRDLKQRYGDDMRAWRWGDAHAALARHRPFHQVPWLARWFDVRVPFGGDMTTVDVGGNDFSDAAAPYETKMAAAMRMVIDMAAPDAARFAMPVGQSGNRFSAWYSDRMDEWANGRYVTIPTDAASVERCACKRLALVPAGG
ncbi:penicillin acylase family protein [Burkholderia stagnalis]|uniref:penicillin acylase family protein n=1 Tax=Burkholderia stagnalis TaxID=1503054 RepID=UPI000B2A14C6|nr:penicillin acylase family protein [Burkholderia stagnalis]